MHALTAPVLLIAVLVLALLVPHLASVLVAVVVTHALLVDWLSAVSARDPRSSSRHRTFG